MTASAVRTDAPRIPLPRAPQDEVRPVPAPSDGRAVAYQRVLHQLVRRELRLLADLATWAEADATERAQALSRHAELIGRILLHHHTVEREAVWPALQGVVPRDRAEDTRTAVAAWTTRCARIDHELRDVGTAARQWRVALTSPARDAFAMACRTLADEVDEQTREEELSLMPLLNTYLGARDWAEIARTSRCGLSPREQLLVLGLALEDSSAVDRVRLLEGVSPSTRTAWRLYGARRYRATVVRLRGAPPAV